MGKWSNIRGKFSGGEFHRGEGNFGKKMEIYKMGLQNKRIYEISSESYNGKVVKYMGKIFWGGISQGGKRNFIKIEQWESGQIYGENVRGEEGRGGNLEGEFRKKMKTYKFTSKNEYMHKVS